MFNYRERHAAVKQQQSSLTCRDVVKKKYVEIQTVKVIPSSNLRPRWQTMEVGGCDRWFDVIGSSSGSCPD